MVSPVCSIRPAHRVCQPYSIMLCCHRVRARTPWSTLWIAAASVNKASHDFLCALGDSERQRRLFLPEGRAHFSRLVYAMGAALQRSMRLFDRDMIRRFLEEGARAEGKRANRRRGARQRCLRIITQASRTANPRVGCLKNLWGHSWRRLDGPGGSTLQHCRFCHQIREKPPSAFHPLRER